MGENSISIENDENAPKTKKQRRVPSLSPSLSNTNKSSKSNQQHRNSSKQICFANDQSKTNSFFTDEELLELDKFGLPEPVTPENIRIITNRLHEAYHEEKIVCVVCDQICRFSKSRTLNLDELLPSFFTVLLKPTGKDGEAPVLHHKLVSQYDVSQHFPGDRRFKHLLLSLRGLSMHVGDCQQKTDCCCSPQLNICVASGCLLALRRGKCLKFAIAQENWIGQLPPHLSNMAYGTLALLRPIQSFGRMVSYSSSLSPTGGTRLTGHLYSTRLNTTLVRQRIPLEPRDAPVKVLLVSPFASDKSASARAKIARTKQDYIIEPEKIKQTLQFWREVDNKIMANIELDDACLDGLPRDDVSPAMFMIDDETLPTSDGETSDFEASNEVGNPSTERLCGGPSLLRSHEESESAIPLSATVTIGSSQSDDMNVNELTANLLNTTAQQPGKEIVTSTDDENTFVVRPSTTFASDSDPEYLEKHYPDLFPFWRGGFGETRKIKISRKAYLTYLPNLSTSSFNTLIFCCRCTI